MILKIFFTVLSALLFFCFYGRTKKSIVRIIMISFHLDFVAQSIFGQETKCSNGKARLIPHEQYCDFYYRCQSDGQAILEKCPNGLAFAGYQQGLIDHCAYPYMVGCPDGVRTMGRKFTSFMKIFKLMIFFCL